MSLMRFIGVVLVLTDLQDLGKFDRLHHWQLGAAMVILG